nr:hypothetical protein [Cohnella sp. REN36]
MVIGTFEQTLELEQALVEIERLGVNPARILAVGMDTAPDPKASAEKRSVDGIEVGLACATASAVIGASCGFALPWGPIWWGLIGAFGGFAIGYAIRVLAGRHAGTGRRPRTPWPEVAVFVECGEELGAQISGIFRRYGALSVGSHRR